MLRNNDDDTPTVRELLGDLALERVFNGKQIRAVNTGKVRTAVFLVPSVGWVDPIATALEGVIEKLAIFRRKDGKRVDDDGDFAKLRLSSKPVVFVAVAANHIPSWFVNAAESVFQILGIDHSLVAALMRRTCRGRVPARFSELEVSLLDFDEVAALVAPGSTASATVGRLAEAIEKKTKVAAASVRLPDFSEATEFGQGHDWGIQLKQDLDDYRRGALGWQDVDRGVLLHGPPGGGKTLYAKSLAEFLRVPLVQLNMAELFSNSGYLDAMVRGQRQAFADARAKAPCLMFIDEIDQVPDLDRTNDRNRDYWAVLVADLLMSLDGSDAGREGIVVIGATNRPNSIAPALKRPGRLERQIYLGPPGPDGIARIIRHHAGDALAGADLSTPARICHGREMTAAMVMEMVRSARRHARRKGCPITVDDLMTVLLASEDWPVEAMRRIAIHEAGHCLLGLMLTPDSLSSVTLSMAHGAFTSFDVDQARIVTAPIIRRHLQVLLGGREAELLFFGDIGSGSGGSRSSDLAKASALAAAARTSFGFDGAAWRCEPDDVYELLRLDPTLRAAVENDLAAASAEVAALLGSRKEALLALSQALLDRRFLDVETMRKIVASTGPGTAVHVPPADAEMTKIDSF